MKVLIIPCGIGMGHASRCTAIGEKLMEKGVEVLFASYGSGYEMLKEYRKYETVKLPDLKFYGGEGELDIKGTAKKSIDAPFIFLKSIYSESRVIKDFKPDVVVADSHYSVPITSKVLGVPCVLVANELTFNFSDIYPQDKTVEYLENGLERFIKDVSRLCRAIIIPDVPESIEIPSKIEDKVFHVGPLLKEDPSQIPGRDELRRKFGFRDDEKIVLVTVGGSEFGLGLLKIVCSAWDLMDCDRIVMVTGPQISQDFIPDCDKILKKTFLEDMMEWMKLSDVVISLAGHTTSMEVTALGIPNIIVPIDNHPEQLKNAAHVEKYGISLVRNMKELTPEGIADDVNMLLVDETLKVRAEKTIQIFSRYSGTEDSVEIILEHAGDNWEPL